MRQPSPSIPLPSSACSCCSFPQALGNQDLTAKPRTHGNLSTDVGVGMAFEVICGGLLRWGSRSLLVLSSRHSCPTAGTGGDPDAQPLMVGRPHHSPKVWSWWVWGQEAGELPLQWLALATACDGQPRAGRRWCPRSELAWGEHPPHQG